MLIKIESIRCPDVSGLVSGCLRNCRPDTPEYATMQMKVTMKDVAREAGVSTATVSHVINKTRFVEKETKDKVLRVMKKLDYYPNFAAQSLRSQKTK